MNINGMYIESDGPLLVDKLHPIQHYFFHKFFFEQSLVEGLLSYAKHMIVFQYQQN